MWKCYTNSLLPRADLSVHILSRRAGQKIQNGGVVLDCKRDIAYAAFGSPQFIPFL